MEGAAKKFICTVLAIIMLLAVAVVPTPVSASSVSGTEYPTVFCHGLIGWGYNDYIDSIVPYWGMGAGDLLDYLGRQGYEVYDVSVGSVSSAWDRACEMYAQLIGTQVDYGQAHCDRANAQYETLVHQRYGRDYSAAGAIVEGWGASDENGNTKKINLVGHSFGGPTCLMLIHLLAEGDADEIAWAKENYGDDWEKNISPLFVGGKVEWVHSLTTLACVLNGTTFISTCHDETVALEKITLALANSLGITPLGAIYDFQLEQFGITNIPGESGDAYLSRVLQSEFLEGDDQAWYDLSTTGCTKLNRKFKTYDSIYYFSYSGNKTYRNITGNYLPKVTMRTGLWYSAKKIGCYTNRYEEVIGENGSMTYISKAWKPNDGMVNSISARYPLDEPHTSYDENNIVQGIWLVKSDQEMDHLDFNGGIVNAKPITIRNFYLQIMADIAAAHS